MPATSSPWMFAVSHRVGPSRLPLTMTTGNCSKPPDGNGTPSNVPYDVAPGAATHVPTVSALLRTQTPFRGLIRPPRAAQFARDLGRPRASLGNFVRVRP